MIVSDLKKGVSIRHKGDKNVFIVDDFNGHSGRLISKGSMKLAFFVHDTLDDRFESTMIIQATIQAFHSKVTTTRRYLLMNWETVEIVE